MNINEIVSMFYAQKTSTGWIAKCPSHDDKTPSLSIREGQDGKILIKCHAGCTIEKICSDMQIKVSDLFNTPLPLPQPTTVSQRKIIATYNYVDADNKLLFQVCRYKPKDFRQRRPDPDRPDSWLWNMQGVERTLYHLPAVIQAVKDGKIIYVVEGEKDVHAVESIGLSATCNPGGAGKWEPQYTKSLRDADCIIIPDKDEPGRKHADLVAKSIRGIAKRVRIIDLPGKIKDFADFIEARDAAEPETIRAEITTLSAQTQVEVGQLPPPLDAAIWALDVLPEPDQIFNGAFDMATKTVLVAPSKLRKSFWLLQAAVSMAGGLQQFLAWDIPKPRRILFWNMEITPPHFHKRLLRMLRALDLTPSDLGDRLFILNTRGIDVAESGLTQIAEIAQKLTVDVIVLDPIYKLIFGDESKQEEIKHLLRGLDHLCTETGAAVIYSHHCGKGFSGDKQAIDRASGSGVLARDFDCQIGLTPHIEDGLIVVEQIARSYPPRDAFTVGWDNTRGCFELKDGVDPVIQTSKNRNMSGRVGPTLTDDDAMALVSDKPLPSEVFKGELRRIGFSDRASREVRARLLENGQLDEFRTKTFPLKIYFGTPENIENFKAEYQKLKLM